MFYLCSILNATIYTPKQTNGVQYGNYTGNWQRAEAKGKGAKGNRNFPKLFTRLPLNASFLSCSTASAVALPTTFVVVSHAKQASSPSYELEVTAPVPTIGKPPPPHDPLPHTAASVNGNALWALSIIICSPRLGTTCKELATR